jgi:hypothetical protein
MNHLASAKYHMMHNPSHAKRRMMDVVAGLTEAHAGEAARRRNVDLYHLTDSARLPSIQANGLDPQQSREPAIIGGSAAR